MAYGKIPLKLKDFEGIYALADKTFAFFGLSREGTEKTQSATGQYGGLPGQLFEEIEKTLRPLSETAALFCLVALLRMLSQVDDRIRISPSDNNQTVGHDHRRSAGYVKGL